MQGLTSRRHTLVPDGTTVIAMFWVLFSVHERLWAMAAPMPLPTMGWAGAVIGLTVAWSVMERKRWGRLALLGIASVTVAYLLGELLRSALSEQLDPSPPTPWDTVPAHVALLAVAVLTLVWLLRGSVRTEFERRKRAQTRRWQTGIAVTLVVIWLLCAWRGGLWRPLAARHIVPRRMRADAGVCRHAIHAPPLPFHVVRAA